MKLIQYSVIIQLFIFFIVGESYPQNNLRNAGISENLFPENEKLNSNHFPRGSFQVIQGDFIITAGKLWTGEPPKSLGEFSFQGKIIQNSGKFNNMAIQLVKDKNRDSLNNCIKMIEKGVEFDPHFFPFRYNLGRFYYQKKEFTKALEEFEYAAKVVPDYFKTYIHIANTQKKLGKIIEFEKNLQSAILLNPFDSEALVLLGEHYLTLQMPSRAKKYFQKAMDLDPLEANAILGQAVVEFFSKNYWKAYKVFKTFQMVKKEDTTPNYNIRFHYYYALSSFEVGDYATAEKEFKAMLEFPLDPFFLEVPYKTILKKMSISKKFAESF
ncbi:MAG: hypothetical protein KDK90_09440 [Leptospiraceae bacterium]|nr:hypothetical protein [Leptospiraceae bacterium]